MMKILLIVGARPNFMKVASIIEAIKEYNHSTTAPIRSYLVHTGQHYDAQMSKTFFDELNLPKPDIDLGVGSGSHAEQTAEIMKRFEPILSKEEPDVVVVVGDVNSTIACSLVASKMVYPRPTDCFGVSRPLVAHVESGLRSFDRSMPEEINRILTDAISDFLFITEEGARENLLRENIPPEKIFFVGNTMVDSLMRHLDQAKKSRVSGTLGLREEKAPPKGEVKGGLGDVKELQEFKARDFMVLTLHRPSNVDDRLFFLELIRAISELSQKMPVLFPIHPRTRQKIEQFGFHSHFTFLNSDSTSSISDSGIYCLDPLGYLDFLWVLSNARLVLTDSGGIQEESTVLGVPCVTLRNNTERPVTVQYGTNVIAGTKREPIVREARKQLERERTPCVPKYWDGKAGRRIIQVLVQQSQTRRSSTN